jgi:hypothetical protein
VKNEHKHQLINQLGFNYVLKQKNKKNASLTEG